MTALEGRVVAIAGAAGGLGPVVVHRLADAGAGAGAVGTRNTLSAHSLSTGNES
jgi:NAD(P)-dependent dehydrogenase (short-subunit alcohol dehydrogenase family)